MSSRTPPDFESQVRAHLESARLERPDSQKRAANLQSLLEGQVTLQMSDAVPPPVSQGRGAIWVGLVLLAALLAALAWWFWGGSAPVSTPVQQLPVLTPRPEPVDPRPTRPANDTLLVVPPVPATADAAIALPIDAGAPSMPAAIDAGVTVAPRRTLDDPDDLARELALLDEARAQLANDAAAALKTLNRHTVRYPRGALRAEADLLRVETLLKLGRTVEAQKVANRLRTHDSEGLVRERLERLLEVHGP